MQLREMRICQVSPTVQGRREKASRLFLQPFSLCSAQIGLLAIGLLTPAHAAAWQTELVSNFDGNLVEQTLLTGETQVQKQVQKQTVSENTPPVTTELPDSKQILSQAAKVLADIPADSLAIEPRSIESDLLASIAQADAPPPQPDTPFTRVDASDRWQVSVEPYFFIPLDVEVDATVAGRSASIDLGLGDVLSFDRAYDAGLRLEVQKNRLSFILDGFYVFARDSGNVGVTFPAGSLERFGINFPVRAEADADLSIRQGVIDVAASYRVVDTRLGDAAAEPSKRFPSLFVAPILGVRTNILRQELEVDNIRVANIPLSINRDFSVSRTTVEPLIGAQIGLDLSDRWAFAIRGDVSGFNIGADTNFTWNLLVRTQYFLSPTTSLQLGYRFNRFDFEDGSGVRRAKVDLRQNGFLVGITFRF